MNNILNYISKIPNNRIAFISENKQYSYFDIKNIYEKNKKFLYKLKNSSVAIKAQERLELILLLSILDGNVKKILFIPKDIENSLIKNFYKISNINYEVYLENEILKLKKIHNDEKIEDIKHTQWIIPTSGTTNSPKLVLHTLESLTRTTIKNINNGEKYIWGLTFDIYRFSGIQVFLQVIASGSSIIIPKSYNTSTSSIIKLFVKYKCNTISATPSFWRKLLMQSESSQLKIQRATLGGEITDETIIKAIKKQFGDIKITHIYASTEVGAVFSISDGQAGFPYSFIEKGIKDIKLKIDKNNLLWIKPEKKIQEYLNKSSMYDQEGFINTEDIVKIVNNRVYFGGRVSGAINVGGNKVQPEEVEMKLLESGLISSAYVFPKKSPILGNIVCAKVTIYNHSIDKNYLKKKLIEYCRENLEKYKIPAIVHFVEELKITQSGKIKRG